LKLVWKYFSLDFSSKTFLMGILNVTPDSFSDGGAFLNRDRAVDQALRMQDEGADIIDIGGESTRPGSGAVTVREEIRRVLPVIEELTGKVNIPISIDTYKSGVAEAAIQAGASIVNDISGLKFDNKMSGVVARHKVPVVIMHIKGRPRDMQKKPVYKSLIPEIMDYLTESIITARNAGIPDNMIIIDPGIGFGKTLEHNLEIIRRLNEFTGYQKPILVGPSRKSFIGKLLGDHPVNDRLQGTAAAVAIGIFNGANIVRVHDVKEMFRVAKIADAIKRG